MQELRNQIYHYFGKLFDAPIWKGAFSVITAICVTLFGEFDQVAKYFMIAFAFDFLTGCYKGIIIDKKNFKSRFMRKTAPKAISYGTAIMMAHFAEQFGAVGFRTFVISLLGFTEIKSIIENLKETKGRLPEFISEELEKYREKSKYFKGK